MYPYSFTETKFIHRTPHTIPKQIGISAVLYATGTPGLESLLAGVPAFRFLPKHNVALDIMPDGVRVIAVTGDDLEITLKKERKPPTVSWSSIMAPVDFDFWRTILKARNP